MKKNSIFHLFTAIIFIYAWVQPLLHNPCTLVTFLKDTHIAI